MAIVGMEKVDAMKVRFGLLRTMSRRKLATGAAALLAISVGYHVVFGANGLTVYMQKRQETVALQRQMQALERENDALQGHVERLQNDPNAIEHQAREELRYTRPGEVIYQLPSPPARQTVP